MRSDMLVIWLLLFRLYPMSAEDWFGIFRFNCDGVMEEVTTLLADLDRQEVLLVGFRWVLGICPLPQNTLVTRSITLVFKLFWLLLLLLLLLLLCFALVLFFPKVRLLIRFEISDVALSTTPWDDMAPQCLVTVSNVNFANNMWHYRILTSDYCKLWRLTWFECLDLFYGFYTFLIN